MPKEIGASTVMRALCYAFAIYLGVSSSLFAEKTSPPSSESFYTTVNKTLSDEDLVKAHKLRGETISSIGILLKEKSLNANQRVELFIRLGELYIENHDFLRNQELKDFETKYDAWASVKDNKAPEPRPNFKESQTSLTKSAIAFKDLLGEYPNNPRNLQVTFTLAKTLARLGKTEAISYFEKFIAKYPKSELITDAYLALGEFYFERDDVSHALPAYQNAAKATQHPAYAYSVFKMGWCYYNLKSKSESDLQNNLKQALNSFQTVVKASEEGKQKSGSIQLREEAIQDLIMVYADLEDVDGAWAYFKELKEEHAFYQMLERLGHMLSESGETEKAAACLGRIV
jgi:tetratricopeptide (TPR) repeat protein